MMPSTYLQGIVRPVDVAPNVLDTDYAVTRQWNVNRTPLYGRLDTRPVDSYVLRQWPRRYRPRTTTLGAAVADAVTTTITLANASIVMNGDNLQLNSGEIVEIIDHPNTTANTVLVLRGACGTTAATQTTGTTVTNLGNSRTGGETLQKPISEIPGSNVQYVQTFQHVYSVAGGVAVIRTRYQGPATPYDTEKQNVMTNLVDDIEYAALYGRAQEVGGNFARYKMNGLFNLLTSINVTAPTNAAGYRPQDLLTDAIEPIIANGGNPNIALVSPKWFSGLATWGLPSMRLKAGDTVFGTPIEAYEIPFYNRIVFIPNPLMEGRSIIVGVAEEMYWGVLRPLESYPIARLGDAAQGEWIGAQAINVDDESHFAAVRNITGFAPGS